MLRKIPLIPASNTAPTSSWQEQLADVVTDLLELLNVLQLDAAQLGVSDEALRDFPLRVPRPYLARMQRGEQFGKIVLTIADA